MWVWHSNDISLHPLESLKKAPQDTSNYQLASAWGWFMVNHYCVVQWRKPYRLPLIRTSISSMCINTTWKLLSVCSLQAAFTLHLTAVFKKASSDLFWCRAWGLCSWQSIRVHWSWCMWTSCCSGSRAYFQSSTPQRSSAMPILRGNSRGSLRRQSKFQRQGWSHSSLCKGTWPIERYTFFKHSKLCQ